MKLLLEISRIFILVCFILFNGALVAQVKISSWNLQHFGKSKSNAEIQFIANTIQDFDIIALQEVVAGYGGAQAVARLAGVLNRSGSKWDYVISDPTRSSSPHAAERYAYIWKTSRIKRLHKPWLEKKFETVIDREPFYVDFSYGGEEFTLVNFHAIPKKKQPETEIKYIKFLPAQYPDRNLIFLGDFNIPQSHTVFNPLKKLGYEPVLTEQKTTMKMKCEGAECLASEYDNIFYPNKTIRLNSSGAILFYKAFPDMISARRISDHIPIWAEIEFISSTRAFGAPSKLILD